MSHEPGGRKNRQSLKNRALSNAYFVRCDHWVSTTRFEVVAILIFGELECSL